MNMDSSDDEYDRISISQFIKKRQTLPENGILPCARIFAVCIISGTRRRPPLPCVARRTHGKEKTLGKPYSPRTQPLDGEVIMRVGGGKKQGRYYIGDGLLDTASTPTLSQIRARSTAKARPYVHDCPRRMSKCMNFRLFLIYS